MSYLWGHQSGVTVSFGGQLTKSLHLFVSDSISQPIVNSRYMLSKEQNVKLKAMQCESMHKAHNLRQAQREGSHDLKNIHVVAPKLYSECNHECSPLKSKPPPSLFEKTPEKSTPSSIQCPLNYTPKPDMTAASKWICSSASNHRSSFQNDTQLKFTKNSLNTAKSALMSSFSLIWWKGQDNPAIVSQRSCRKAHPEATNLQAKLRHLTNCYNSCRVTFFPWETASNCSLKSVSLVTGSQDD